MSSTNKSKYLSHITTLCVAQLLKQIGIDRCSKNALQLLTDLFACHLGHLSNIISASGNSLTFRTTPSFSLTDGIFVLEEEIGEFSTRSSRWTNFLEFAERQIALSKLFSKFADTPNICMLNVLVGLPLKLDIGGKDSHLAVVASGEDEDEEMPFLPPKPTVKSVELAEGIEENAPAIERVQSIEIPAIEIEHNIFDRVEQPLDFPFDPLMAEGSAPKSFESLVADLSCSVPNDIFVANFVPKQVDLAKVVLQNLFNTQLWVSNEPQILPFFASNPNRGPALVPIVLSSSNPTSAVNETAPHLGVQLITGNEAI